MLKVRTNNLGFTLLELVVAMSIFSLIVLVLASFLIDGWRYNTIIWDQLQGQTDARRVVQETVNIIRKAEESSIGAFPVVLAKDNELIIYANVDTDFYRERIRFWLDGTTLKRGIIKPSGNPLNYSGTEQVVDLAHYVVNISKGIPLFIYYDENYTGVENPLTTPAEVALIKLVKVQLLIEKNPDKTPIPLRVESMVQIRNLKSN